MSWITFYHFKELLYYIFALAPIGGKINQCHFGDLRVFFRGTQYMYLLTYVLTFGAGQKNNQCHGLVALTRWAPLDISKNTLEIHSIICHDLKIDIWHELDLNQRKNRSTCIIFSSNCRFSRQRHEAENVRKPPPDLRTGHIGSRLRSPSGRVR